MTAGTDCVDRLAFVATHVAHLRSPIFWERWYNRGLCLAAGIILIDHFPESATLL